MLTDTTANTVSKSSETNTDANVVPQALITIVQLQRPTGAIIDTMAVLA